MRGLFGRIGLRRDIRVLLFGPLAVMKAAFLCFGKNQSQRIKTSNPLKTGPNCSYKNPVV
jgi:hypothetical protein